MIIVQLKGGLGNQLFQYAAALHLGIHHKVPVKVDISLLNTQDRLIGTHRTFDLLSIKEPPIVASTDEIKKIKGNSFFTYFQKRLPAHKRNQYKEVDYTYDFHFLDAGNNIYLKGYRQSEKYFSPISDYLKNAFSINENLVTDVSMIHNQMKSELSVAVHIRRGDYKNLSVLEFHGILDIDYYKQAIRKIQTLHPTSTFYFFSDDINWVKNHLSIDNSVCIDSQISKSSISDFYLISSCQHQIIANSTFSWWAAYLNPNPNKIVIAPKKWFNSAPNNTKDLFPADWITL
jgi:hypothetical protein